MKNIFTKLTSFFGKPTVEFAWEPGFEDLQLPCYANPGDSGLDLRAGESAHLAPKSRKLITTGLRMKLPHGFEGQVRSRSGLALKQGIVVLNSPGTIDTAYRGIVGVVLYNSSDEVVTINRGDRIAQLVISPVVEASIKLVSGLDMDTVRGSGGFGSTGSK